jgi:hypothetical protein
VQREKAVALKSDRNDVDAYDEWKRTKGEYAAMKYPEIPEHREAA